MAPRQMLLTQSELTRYARAMRDAGVTDYKVIVHPDGAHEVIAGRASVMTDEGRGPDPDELLK